MGNAVFDRIIGGASDSAPSSSAAQLKSAIDELSALFKSGTSYDYSDDSYDDDSADVIDESELVSKLASELQLYLTTSTAGPDIDKIAAARWLRGPVRYLRGVGYGIGNLFRALAGRPMKLPPEMVARRPWTRWVQSHPALASFVLPAIGFGLGALGTTGVYQGLVLPAVARSGYAAGISDLETVARKAYELGVSDALAYGGYGGRSYGL